MKPKYTSLLYLQNVHEYITQTWARREQKRKETTTERMKGGRNKDTSKKLFTKGLHIKTIDFKIDVVGQ